MAKKKTGMTAAEFYSSADSLSGGYLFVGQEDYLKKSYFRIAKEKTVDEGDIFNTFEITADNYSAGMLSDSLEVLPVMSDRKFIDMHDMRLDQMRKDDFDALCTVLSMTGNYPETVLIFYIAADEDEKCAEKVTKLSACLQTVNFDREPPARLKKWVSKHFRSEGVFADEVCCDILVETCKSDMYTLSAEAAKLSAYVLSKGRDRLTPEDIAAVTPERVEIGAFDFTDAVLFGNSAKALEIIRRYELKREAPEMILGSITRTVCSLYLAKSALKSGLTPANAAEKYGWKPFVAERYCRVASKISGEKLDGLLKSCFEADSLIKSGFGDRYLVLEWLAAETIIRRN